MAYTPSIKNDIIYNLYICLILINYYWIIAYVEKNTYLENYLYEIKYSSPLLVIYYKWIHMCPCFDNKKV